MAHRKPATSLQEQNEAAGPGAPGHTEAPAKASPSRASRSSRHHHQQQHQCQDPKQEERQEQQPYHQQQDQLGSQHLHQQQQQHQQQQPQQQRQQPGQQLQHHSRSAQGADTGTHVAAPHAVLSPEQNVGGCAGPRGSSPRGAMPGASSEAVRPHTLLAEKREGQGAGSRGSSPCENRGERRRRKRVPRVPSPADSYEWLKYGEKRLVMPRRTRAYFKCARNKDLGCAAKKSMDTRETDSGKVQVLTTSYTGKHNHEEATITTSSHVRSPTLSPLSNRGIPDSTDLAERPQQCTESVEGADILEVEQPQALEDREHGGLGASMPSWEVEDWDVDEWQVDLRLLGGADDRKGQGSGSGLPSDPVTAPAKSEPCEEFLEEDGCSHGQSTRAPTPDPTQLLPKASRIDPSSPFPSLSPGTSQTLGHPQPCAPSSLAYPQPLVPPQTCDRPCPSTGLGPSPSLASTQSFEHIRPSTGPSLAQHCSPQPCPAPSADHLAHLTPQPCPPPSLGTSQAGLGQSQPCLSCDNTQEAVRYPAPRPLASLGNHQAPGEPSQASWAPGSVGPSPEHLPPSHPMPLPQGGLPQMPPGMGPAAQSCHYASTATELKGSSLRGGCGEPGVGDSPPDQTQYRTGVPALAAPSPDPSSLAPAAQAPCSRPSRGHAVLPHAPPLSMPGAHAPPACFPLTHALPALAPPAHAPPAHAPPTHVPATLYPPAYTPPAHTPRAQAPGLGSLSGPMNLSGQNARAPYSSRSAGLSGYQAHFNGPSRKASPLPTGNTQHGSSFTAASACLPLPKSSSSQPGGSIPHPRATFPHPSGDSHLPSGGIPLPTDRSSDATCPGLPSSGKPLQHSSTFPHTSGSSVLPCTSTTHASGSAPLFGDPESRSSDLRHSSSTGYAGGAPLQRRAEGVPWTEAWDRASPPVRSQDVGCSGDGSNVRTRALHHLRTALNVQPGELQGTVHAPPRGIVYQMAQSTAQPLAFISTPGTSAAQGAGTR